MFERPPGQPRVLKLDPAVREPFLELVAREHPALHPRYEQRYAGVRLDPEYARVIDDRVARVRSRHRFPADLEADEEAPEQLRLAV